MKVEEFVLGLFEDGAYPGVIKSVTTESIDIELMKPIVING